MQRIYVAEADTYVTNRVIDGVLTSSFRSNVGFAGTIDIFKLYGATFSGSAPNTELSRALLRFDLDPIRSLVSDGKIDVGAPSFKAFVKLTDVYGGQPCPAGFTLCLAPMSRSWDEGLGKDIVLYGDKHSANYLTSSGTTSLWDTPGANTGAANGSTTADYLTSFSGGSFSSMKQTFVAGTEDMSIDVTLAISASIAGLIPDEGFRLAFSASHEVDDRTYFVKRFASRHAYEPAKRPKLVVMYDDSIQDDFSNTTFDVSGSVFLYSYTNGRPVQVLSGATTISGLNCLKLKLVTDFSGTTSTATGSYSLVYTGSQHRSGINWAEGVYSASFLIPRTDPYIAHKLSLSSSVVFTPYWMSLDDSVCYATGSDFTVRRPYMGSVALVNGDDRMTVACNGIRDTYISGDLLTARVDMFDPTSPMIRLVKTPVIVPSVVRRDVHYSIVDADTGLAVVPFDTTYNSTRCSSDSNGNYFDFDTTSLVQNRTYRIDVLLYDSGRQDVFRDCSNKFKVLSNQ